MGDLISRSTAIAELMQMVKAHEHEIFRGELLHYTGIKAMLEAQPTVDAVPVKHGRWIDHKDEHQCSECKEITIVDFYVWKNVQFDYCPYCGAKMDGEKHGTD